MNDLQGKMALGDQSTSLSIVEPKTKSSNFSYEELLELVHCLYQENKKLRCMNQHLDAQIDMSAWGYKR